MNILIVCRHQNVYSTKRLKIAAKKRKHNPIVINPNSFTLYAEKGHSGIFYKNQELKDIDVVIPRMGITGVEYGLSVVRQFGMLNIPVINSSEAISRSKDKFECLQFLAQKGIDVPPTILTRTGTSSAFNRIMFRLGGCPAILKFIRGSQGKGVVIAESSLNAKSILEAMRCLDKDAMIQKYICEADGCDTRVFVLNGKARAAMKRIAKPGEFRSNIHLGAKGIEIKISKETAQLAEKAVKILGLELAGVDILETKTGPVVIEVNSSPGFQGLEHATGLDIADMIIRYAEEKARMKNDR
ncbi:MAG: RimK family alpha-L-glutamate ligase [Planctomycetes bacterium]|nr:RimK family alpha-L-glutamate ligase [Planctomycetota bacterium]